MSSRPLAVAAVLVATGLVTTGCGGSHAKVSHKAAPSPTVTVHATTPPPTYKATQVSGAVLTTHDIGNSAHTLAVSIPSLHADAVPSCSNSAIPLQGKPLVEVHQFGGNDNQYYGFNYGQIIALYPTPDAAANSFSSIRTKLASCPAKHHIPAKYISGSKVALEHDDTWQEGTNTLTGWLHIRGYEKHVEPPSTSILNVYYDMYDYALRGNVIVASLYWQRVKPSASGAPIATKATELLEKQLAKIG